MPVVTIIIPVYQVKNYLERCVSSVLSQTFTDYEIVLVDDGSTDGSGEICDRYAAKYNNIKVIHKENSGLSSARNAGLQLADSKYIMFVDSDDMIHSKTLETQISLLEDNSADCVICPLQRFSHLNEIDAFSEINKSDFSVVTGIQAEKGFFNNPNAGMYVSSCGKVFKRELLEGIRFPEGRLFEDEFITYKVYFKSDKVVILNQPLYYYFVNANGITQNLTLNKRFDSYDAQYERTHFFLDNGCIELYKLSLMGFMYVSQWDLLTCHRGNVEFNTERGKIFQRQFTTIFDYARKEKLISFYNNYDYYVLAYPQYTLFFRIVRLGYLIFKKLFLRSQ